jgi:hypothetical protein
MRGSQVRFIRQQGFSAPDSNNRLYAALMFQPGIVGCLVLLGGWRLPTQRMTSHGLVDSVPAIVPETRKSA